MTSKNAKEKFQVFGRIVRPSLFWLAVLALPIVPPGAYLLTKDIALAGLFLTCITLFCFLLRFDEIQELSIGGLKARMRETIREALATTAQLRQIATAVSRVALTDLAAGNFFIGMSSKLRFRLYQELRNALEETGVSPEQIKSAVEEWQKATAIVFAREITNLVCATHPNSTSLKGALEKLTNFRDWQAPKASQIEDILKAHSITPTDIASQLIEDMKQFEQSGKIPDEDRLAKVIDKT